MKAIFSSVCSIGAAAALAGCSTLGIGGDDRDPRAGMEVTRYHLGQPVARGQIAVEPFDTADANMPEFRSYAGSVQRQLVRLGWTPGAGDGQSEQIALIDVQQGSRGAIRQRMGVGGGAQVAAGVASPDLVATILEVRIKRRSDGTVFWEGRAMSEAQPNSAEAGRTAAVERLADALFRDFPGESGRTIRLR